jgi:hypothetical protein
MLCRANALPLHLLNGLKLFIGDVDYIYSSQQYKIQHIPCICGTRNLKAK